MQSVVMVEYDPEWPARFEKLRERIAAVLGPMALQIEHVGSTSVPSMCAKPIIDLDVVVRREDVPAAISAVEALGYRHEGNLGLSGARRFAGPQNFPNTTCTFARKAARRSSGMCWFAITCGSIRKWRARTRN